MINNEFYTYFIESINHALEIEISEKLNVGTPYISQERSVSTNDVSVVIGIVGKKLRGQMLLTMSEECALNLAGKLTGKKHEILGPDGKSALSELFNIISGYASQGLTRVGIDSDITPPSIFIGKGMKVNFEQDSKTFVIPFTLTTGGIDMVLSIKKLDS